MKKLLPGLFIIIWINLSAQNKTAEKFAAAITPEELKSKLTIIAGADMQGRETATEGQRKAAAYIENYFKQLKLLPGNPGNYQLSFPVYQDSLVSASCKVNKKDFLYAQDFAIAGSTVPQGSWIINNLVFAGCRLTSLPES